jgi:hypothetical protein
MPRKIRMRRSGIRVRSKMRLAAKPMAMIRPMATKAVRTSIVAGTERMISEALS